jgi:hypothetical protein
LVRLPDMYCDEASSKPAHANPAYAAPKFIPAGNMSATRPALD